MENRAPTAFRTGTGKRAPSGYRQPTGQKDQNAYVSVGQQDLHIVDRPVTQQGIGLKTGPSGPGRKVYDKTYYLNALRQKCKELDQEMSQFKKESEKIQNDNQEFNTLERKYEALIMEVRKLEGELADFNLTLDKQRTETRPEDIYVMFEHVQLQNERYRQQLDDMFIERKQQEEQIQEMEHQIMMINQEAEMKLGSLDPETRREYESLQQENQMLQQDIVNKRSLMEEINQKLQIADQRLKMDPLRERAHILKQQKQQLQQKKEELEIQTGELNLSFPQARERLLAKVKEINNEIQQSERRINEVKAAIANYHQQLKQMSSDMQNQPGAQQREEEAKKIEQLNKRDQEMTDFIDSFANLKQQELAQMTQLEQNIIAILSLQSKDIERQYNIPTAENVNEWRQDYEFKQDQAKFSAVTLERLKMDREERLKDLEKINTLDSKISKEMEQLEERRIQMTSEIDNKFSKIEEMKALVEKEKNRLVKERGKLQQRKDTQSQINRILKHKLDTKQQQLTNNKVHADLLEIEKKLLTNEQNIFSLKQFVESKTAETDYQPLMQECASSLSELNDTLSKNVFK